MYRRNFTELNSLRSVQNYSNPSWRVTSLFLPDTMPFASTLPIAFSLRCRFSLWQSKIPRTEDKVAKKVPQRFMHGQGTEIEASPQGQPPPTGFYSRAEFDSRVGRPERTKSGKLECIVLSPQLFLRSPASVSGGPTFTSFRVS